MPDEDTLYSDEDVIPFPEMEDRLFTTERYSRYNAQVTYALSDDSFYTYVSGYKEAADRLVQSLIEDARHIDLVVFPTVFLYPPIS